ncbi:MAG: alpha/beta hydrolase [Candidatus Izemoplasmatales bacterium]
MRHRLLKVLLVLLTVLLLLPTALVLLAYRPDLSRERLEETYYTAESHYATVTVDDLDGNPVEIDLHYRDVGGPDDPVVVLLHGMFSSLGTFDAWIVELLASGYRVVAVDLPNHGLSGGFSDGAGSRRRSAAAVKGILDLLGVETCVLAGNSMGGGVAWELAGAHHGVDGFAVAGLVLIDAVHPDLGSGAPEGAEGLRSHPRLAGFLSHLTPRFLLKRILGDVYGSASMLTEGILDRYYDLLRKDGNREAVLLTHPEEEPDGSARLDAIRDAGIPVLVLWGEEDSWIDAAFAEAFATSLDLAADRVIVYPGLGHVPMEEDPAATAADLLTFLGELPF